MTRVLRPFDTFLRLPGMPAVAAPLLLAVVAGLTACAGGGRAQAGSSDGFQGNWQLVSIQGRAAAGQTMQIDTEGRVSGFAGCNRYVSNAQSEGGGRVSFAPGAATKMACLEEGAMQSEAAFLGMLGAVRGFRMRDAELLLLDESGAVLAQLTAQK